MATKKAASKAAKTTREAAAATVKKATGGAAKKASHTVAKSAKKVAKKATANVASPEKERSQPQVGAGTVGAAARDEAVAPEWAQAGDVLTTATGTPVDNTDNSVRVGPRGPALYDALVVAGGASAATLASDAHTAVNLGEAFRHHKVVAAWGEGLSVLEACGIGAHEPGVVTGDAVDAGFAAELVEAMGWHRHWERLPA